MLVLFLSCCSTSQATQVMVLPCSRGAFAGELMRCAHRITASFRLENLSDHWVQHVAFNDKVTLLQCPYSDVATGHRNVPAQRLRSAAGMATACGRDRMCSQGKDTGSEYIFRSYSRLTCTPNSRNSCCLWKGSLVSETVLSTGYIF